MNPKISVIMPAYNAEQTIEHTVSTILKSSMTDFELIIVNDGSTDATFDICINLQKKDSRIIVIDKKNEGVSAARNSGIKKATGKYLYFCDSDDELLPNALEDMYSFADANNADAVVGGFETYYADTGESVLTEVTKSNRLFFGIQKKDLIKMFISHSINGLYSVWNKLYLRSKIINHGILFDLKRSQGEDWKFNLIFFMKADRVIFINTLIYKYFIYKQENFSGQFKKYGGNTAYCITDANRLKLQAIEKFNISFENEAGKLFYVNCFFTIMSAVEYYLNNPDKKSELKSMIKDESTKKIFKAILSIKNKELSKYSISRKHKAVILLLKSGFTDKAFKLYSK